MRAVVTLGDAEEFVFTDATREQKAVTPLHVRSGKLSLRVQLVMPQANSPSPLFTNLHLVSSEFSSN